MIRAAIIIPLFRGRGGERKLSEIKHLNPRSRGKHGQAGLLFSGVQVLLERLQCLLTAGKCFDSQDSHPHSTEQKHYVYLRKSGTITESILQHTGHRNTFGSKTKFMRSQQAKPGQMWFILPQLTLPVVFTISGKPDHVRMAGMSPWNVLGGEGRGGEGSSPGCASGAAPTSHPSPAPLFSCTTTRYPNSLQIKPPQEKPHL